jgi:hypothetical protein
MLDLFKIPAAAQVKVKQIQDILAPNDRTSGQSAGMGIYLA